MSEGAQSAKHIKQSLAAEVLRSSGRVQLIAFGYSMLPSLWPGDLLTIEVRPFEQVRRGEVVLYARSGRLFIHRVLRVEQRQIVARGDSMPSPDEPVRPGEFMGVVAAVGHADTGTRPVPGVSPVRRLIGLALAYSGKLRSLALRWRARTVEVPVITQRSSVG